MKTHSQAFMLQTRLQAIEFMLVHEASLINAQWHQQLARWPEENEAAHAQRKHEMDQLFAWCDYLRSKAENEFSSLPPRMGVEEPRGECLPRSKERWSVLLGDVMDADEDPILQYIIEMTAALMVWSLVGGTADLALRDKVLNEMKRRLKPLPQDGGKGGDVVTKASALQRAPAPRPPAGRR